IIPRGTILETTDDMWYAALDINLTAAFTKNLGRDHAGDGIRVNAVCPHEVNTPMLRSGFVQRGLGPDTAIEALGKTVPLGHVADPAEIADVIAFLASDESRYVCGETIEVTGAKPVSG
ncbi:MAG: SDR family NAD(P)-dependent oxidoreductase, partial [Gammaproteobacteria bacterium]